jgi:hypothetical protein
MITDTHRLRRSIVALLDNSPKKTLSYRNIAKMFPNASEGEIRSNINGIVHRGFATRNSDYYTLTQGEWKPTNSAELYNKLTEGTTYRYKDIHSLSEKESSTTDSALETLLSDQGLLRVDQGRYICQQLPPIYRVTQSNIKTIALVCPVQRAIWDHLTSDINSYDKVREDVTSLSSECTRHRFARAIKSLVDSNSILLQRGLILKGELNPLDADILYDQIKHRQDVLSSDLKSVGDFKWPTNVISTLRRLGALERISHGHYKVMPLPQLQTQQENLQQEKWQTVAEALMATSEAKRIFENLLSEAEIKKQEVTRLREEARVSSRRADKLEASFSAPLASAEQKAMEARNNLSNILKQNGLL